jgi:acyl-coenzyme A synthetase/AMP-(fatty) acid ligase
MSSWILERFSSFANRPALAGAFGRVSYAELGELVREANKELAALKLTGPTAFALVGEQSPASVAWSIALAAQHHFVVPLAGDATEHAKKLAQIHVRWIVVLDGLTWKLFPRVDETAAPSFLQTLIEKNHAGLVLFSSGTSGVPKAMVQDFEVLLDTYKTRRESHLAIIAMLGGDHIGGINTLFGTLCAGAFLVIPANRTPQCVADAIRQHHVVVLPATPTFLNLLLVSGETHLPSLRLITYGTEPMPESLLLRLRENFTQVRFTQTFGTSETGILKTSSPNPDSTFLSIDDASVEWKIIDNELWLRTKTQVQGYLNSSNEVFTSDGWFRTGDKVEVGPNRTLRVLGRLGEQINVGGEKVMPTEVESIILKVPGVIDCRVFGEKSAIIGQTVAAEVVAQNTQDLEKLRASIRATCRSVLSAYKVPTRINFTNSITAARLKKLRPQNT